MKPALVHDEICESACKVSYQGVAEVLGGGTVGVGGLDNTNRDVVDASRLDEVDNVHGGKSSNLVSVQQLEGVVYFMTSNKALLVSFLL